ncbi:PTS lactose transporter subunit IIBC [Companilactobacillus crustorum]|uniref:PTS system lactose-specific EIICB component n=3 Tax=Companilactobacillus TaxID=2767879 RepID=A0A837RGE1_9LACO|nr:PTS lactose transporter subunit IIBC [Companilactobacillus crustorum]KRK42076.1 PTS system lactose-specific transporter subunit IIBC [Companilactobacillus crustorum JCM 15951]KRO20632.1 PTS system lactose-specific transporter subunit IIBC [Companilactobacillus crustorum]GEO77650.1 PTS lactose transporter subunit IIBC [Companilactobacillus crustorum]
MQFIIDKLEAHQKFFDKISKNIYLMAIKDGFLAAMPIILFSSIFILITSVLPLVGVHLPAGLNDWCNKIYNYTMGFVGLYVAGTTAKALTGSKNQRIKGGRFINSTSTMMASMCGFMLLAIGTTKSGAYIGDYFGTKGLLSAFVSAFATVAIYKFCVERDITIKMPKEVPGAIAQNFRDIFPFSFSIIAMGIIDALVRLWLHVPFGEMLTTLISPLFKGAESYWGMAIIWFLIPLFWFMGIHGPSVVKPALEAALYGNTTANLALFKAGHFPYHSLTENFGNFVGELGGTGATFVVPFIFILLMKSKQLKAIGKASIVPVMFAVNEPLLFGAPIILNPYFFIPFVLSPMVNVVVGKMFIDLLHMRGFMYVLSWALPGPIGIFLNTNMQVVSLLLVVVLLALDTLIYLPFCKAYDASLVKQEAAADAKEATDGVELAGVSAEGATVATSMNNDTNETATTTDSDSDDEIKLDHQVKVLVLCAGGGTSEQLANALMDGAKEYNVPIVASAGAYGSHHDILPNYDLVVLAPQVRTYYDDLKADTDRLGIQLVATKGQQYIALTRDSKKALNFVMDNLNKKDDKD